MPTTIESLQASWSAYQPASATGVLLEETGAVGSIFWGIPSAGSPTKLSFTPIADTVKELQQEFSLGSLSFNNRPRTGQEVTSATLQLAASVAGKTALFDIHFSLLASASSLEVTLLDIGDTLTSGVSKLQIVGLSQGGLPAGDKLQSPAYGAASATLLVKLVASAAEAEHCAFSPSVFAPKGCEAPAICPIPDEPVVADCGIPEQFEPIYDCAGLEMPPGDTIFGETLEMIDPSIGGGEPGEPGPPGPPGQNGQDGCYPDFILSYRTEKVDNCDDARVTVDKHAYGACGLALVFTFYVCSGGDDGCCKYKWCDGQWVKQDDPTEAGGTKKLIVMEPIPEGTTTTADPEATTTTTTAAPGEEDEDGCTEPPVEGRFEGEVVIICPCSDGTCVQTSCEDPQQLDETVSATIAQTGGECACMSASLDITYDEENSEWTGSAMICGEEVTVGLSCSGVNWHISLECGEDAQGVTAVITGAAPDFVATGTFSSSDFTGACCEEATGEDDITVTITMTECDTGVIEDPPECVVSGCLPEVGKGLTGAATVSVSPNTCPCFNPITDEPAIYDAIQTSWIATWSENCESEVVVEILCLDDEWYCVVNCGDRLLMPASSANIAANVLTVTFTGVVIDACCDDPETVTIIFKAEICEA